MSATSTLAVTHASSVLQLAKEVDDDKVTPGVLGFIVFALLGAAVWLLMKSMTKHMKKVDFEEAEEKEQEAEEKRPGKATATASSGQSRASGSSSSSPSSGSSASSGSSGARGGDGPA